MMTIGVLFLLALCCSGVLRFFVFGILSDYRVVMAIMALSVLKGCLS